MKSWSWESDPLEMIWNQSDLKSRQEIKIIRNTTIVNSGKLLGSPCNRVCNQRFYLFIYFLSECFMCTMEDEVNLFLKVHKHLTNDAS